MKRRRGEADKEQDKSHGEEREGGEKKKRRESEIIEKNVIKTQC